MSMETRSSSALFKRAEQLKRWEESETNRESPIITGKSRKIKFSAGCVFLAACAAGDKEEVLRLIQSGADIDTANVDGLTALHQACIDDNLDMVEFLVENGADVNRGDNEGWTPLHATASCGFISIAKYLIEHRANVAAVNNDGELPLDIAESDEMEDMLQQHVDEQGIDCDEARNKEERLMLEDAKDWLSSGEIKDILHPKTGASSLFVAAAKGYIKVMDILMQAGADVNIQDFDGWTPLHAAAHWGQREACEILVENFCDMDKKNLVGQTAFDVADTDMVRTLDELRKKQTTLQRDRGDINSFINKKLQPKRRLSGIDKIHSNKEITWEKDRLAEDLSPKDKIVMDIPQVELQIQPEIPNSISEDNHVEKKNRVNRDEQTRIPTTPEVTKTVPINPAPSLPPKQGTAENDDSLVPSWRRPGSFRNRGGETPSRNLTLRIGEKDNSVLKVTLPTGTPPRNPAESTQEVGLRRTQSFEADEKFYKRYCELRAKINAGNSCPALHAASLPTRSASLKEKTHSRRGLVREDTRLVSPTSVPPPLPPGSCVATATTTTTTTTVNTPVSTNTTTVTTPPSPSPSPQHTSIRRSFVPPVRDEESETQRKAHAKRVRETRRSTQGVTLEEIKSAEQLVKKKNQQQLHQATQQLNNIEQSADGEEPLRVTATITTAETMIAPGERRPSWRLRVDNGSKFMLEDARSSASGGTNSMETNRQSAPVPESALRRTLPSSIAPRPASAPLTDTADTTVTIALRRQNKPPDDKEDKENDIRNAQATQAVIQRRRRPKRRSTGVVHVDMDEIDPDRQEPSGGGGENEDVYMNNTESGVDRSGRSSRLSSTTPAETTANGELDYKKLYEESRLENERLRETLKKTEEDLIEAKSAADKSVSPNKNSLSEIEKRERRAMERKLSEMEEELKQFQKLKAENERLRAENRALTRVVSKLTASANAGK